MKDFELFYSKVCVRAASTNFKYPTGSAEMRLKMQNLHFTKNDMHMYYYGRT